MKTPLGATTRMVPGDPKSARRPSTTGDTKNTKNTNTTNTKKKNWTMRQTFASAGVIMLQRKCITVVAKKIAWTDRSGPPKSVLFQFLEHLNRSIFRVREC